MQGGQADVIVMDFSKAFDVVDHQRLLLKLHRLCINHGVIDHMDPVFPFSVSSLMAKNQIHVLSCQVSLKGQYWVHVFSSCI